MFVDKNKELYKGLLKKIIIIVIGSIVLPMELHLHYMQDLVVQH